MFNGKYYDKVLRLRYDLIYRISGKLAKSEWSKNFFWKAMLPIRNLLLWSVRFVKYPSQLGQDKWVLETLNYKKNGYFVDIGAYDGIILSNTYTLEKRYGWNGICAEPGFSRKQLLRNRKCNISTDCIYSESGKNVSFSHAGELGGINEFNPHSLQSSRTVSTNSMTTLSFYDLLKKFNAPKHIDYLSIDTEGSEYEILRTFPFSEYTFATITVEHNYDEIKRNKIYDLLRRNGYRRAKQVRFDDWYVREQINA